MEFLFNFLDTTSNLSLTDLKALEQIVLLVLTIPLVTTLTGILRHIIGLKTLSVYAPIVLTFSFYQLGGFISPANVLPEFDYIRGLKLGLSLFTLVYFSSAIIYIFVMKGLRMHYIPKSTIVLVAVSIVSITAIILGVLVFNTTSLVYLDIFSLVMIITLSDTVISILARKDFIQTTLIALQTLIIALISYTIISLDATRQIVIQYGPILILLILLINLYVGRFVGLRLTEYWRFRKLLTQETYARKKNSQK